MEGGRGRDRNMGRKGERKRKGEGKDELREWEEERKEGRRK